MVDVALPPAPRVRRATTAYPHVLVGGAATVRRRRAQRCLPATAVVTGATRGIGRAVVDSLVERGVSVGCVARSPGELAALQRQLTGRGEVAVVSADVGAGDEVGPALDQLAGTLGPIDALINNAGVGLYGPVARLRPADAERLMRTNYLGMVNATVAVLPDMLQRGSGHIVNMASIAGRLGAPLEAAYSASKFAVVGFSEALALEVASSGVSVSVVDPGPVDTGFFDTRGAPYRRAHPRPVDPGRVADAVIGVLTSRSFETTVPRTLGLAVLVRHLLPRLYLPAARLGCRSELARLGRRPVLSPSVAGALRRR